MCAKPDFCKPIGYLCIYGIRQPYRMRSSIKEAVKLVFVGAVGFLLRMCLESLDRTSSRPVCASCPECTVAQTQANDDVFSDDLQLQLIEPFEAKNRHQVLRYDYFNKTDIFNNFEDSPRLGLLEHQKLDVRDMVHQSIALLNSGRKVPWKLRNIRNGYRRIDPLRGQEFILDVEIYPSKGNGQHEVRRLQLVKPFSPAQLLSEHAVDNAEMVHFILPISRVTDRFYSFMKNFDETCLQVKEHVYLLIVLFAGDSPSDVKMVSEIRGTVQSLLTKYPSAHIRIIQTNIEFSRATGLDLGIKQLSQDALIFFCDVDVIFGREFLARCRQNAVQGKQVYYPMVYAQFDPVIVKKYSPSDQVKDLMKINKYTGHWVHYGFGMVCVYNTDYRVVGGFKLDIKGWGGEDVDLYTKHVQSKLKVFRAAETDLIHVYHRKDCDAGLTVDQLRMCRDSAGEGIGSRQQLGKLITETDITP